MPAFTTLTLKRTTARVAVFALAGTLSLGLASCLTSDETDGSGAPRLSVNSGAKILLNTPPSGGEPGTLVVRSTEYYCTDEVGDPIEGTAIAETYVDTTRYVITGGKLYNWTEGDCWADVQSGTSTTLVGTWTIDPANSTVKVPVAYRESHCQAAYDECEVFGDCPDDVSEGEDAVFQNVTATSRVMADSITTSVTGDLCLAASYGTLFTVMTDSLVVPVSNGCTEATLRNTESQETATFTSSAQGNVHTVSYKHKGTTCSFELYQGAITATTNCSEVPETNFDGFVACLGASGFFTSSEEDFALMKKSLETSNEALEILKGKNLPFHSGR